MMRIGAEMNYMSDGTRSFENSRGKAALSCLMDIAVFCMGISLPGICFASEFTALKGGLMARIAPVDVLVMLVLIMLLATRGLKVKMCGVLYCLALVLSFVVAMFLVGWTECLSGGSGVAVLALMMSLLYWLLGYNISRWPYLMRIYLLGITAGLMWEGAIVLHDYFLPNDKWFIDRKLLRVRGTFMRSGQLGTYGLSCAGIMFSVGLVMFKRHAIRILMAVMGLLSCFIVLASSRRTGLVALAVWGLLCLCCLCFTVQRKYRWKILLGLSASVAVVALIISRSSDSFFVQRWLHFYGVITNPDSFPYEQARAAVDHVKEWLPFGLGVGRGQVIADGSEFHNANLALLVETGLFGFAMFYWLIIDAGLSWWRAWKDRKKPYVSYIFICFLAAMTVYMLHNRVHRSRGFMLMLGLASGAGAAVVASRKRDDVSGVDDKK
jgi:hypothetical protein